MTQEILDKIDLWHCYNSCNFYLKSTVSIVYGKKIDVIFTYGSVTDESCTEDFIVNQTEFSYIKQRIIDITIENNPIFRDLIEKHFRLSFYLCPFQTTKPSYKYWLHSGNNKQLALDYLQSILVTN